MSEKLAYKSLSARIFNLKLWVKNIQPEDLKTTFNNLLSVSEFHVLNFSEHFFPNQGYTALWLLAESHLAIHTFPQNGWSYVELSGCNEEKTKQFHEKVQNEDFEINWETDHIFTSSPNC